MFAFRYDHYFISFFIVFLDFQLLKSVRVDVLHDECTELFALFLLLLNLFQRRLKVLVSFTGLAKLHCTDIAFHIINFLMILDDDIFFWNIEFVKIFKTLLLCAYYLIFEG